MSTASIQQQRDEYVNRSAGVIGVVIFDEEGKRQGLAVKPGDSVFLTERDRIATANAPRRDEDNPFLNGLDFVRAADDMISRRAITSPEQPEGETAVEEQELPPEGAPPEEVKPADYEDTTPPLPEGDPEHGVRQPTEEVGTPEAVAQAGTQQRRQGRGTTVKSGNPVAKPATPGAPTGVVVGQNGPEYKQETPTSTEE